MGRLKRRAYATVLVALILVLCNAALAQESGRTRVVASPLKAEALSSTLDRARQLLQDKQPQQAYDLLHPHEAEWSGYKDFDYLLGVAALDSGRPEEAVFSLQRVVAADPEYPAARMELARAYYETKDFEAARQEFELLERSNPPPFARRVIGNYLSAINRRGVSEKRGVNLFVEFGGGYDTNANGATQDDQFLGFTLDEQNVEQESVFAQISYGARFNFPLTARTTSFIFGGGTHRWNFEADFVNSDRTNVDAGLIWRDGPTELFGSVGIYATYLDSNFIASGDFNHRGAVLDLGAARALSDRFRLGGEARAGRVEYDRNLSVRDVNQYVFAGTLDYQENLVYQPRFGIAIIVGQDDALEARSPYGRDLSGVRATYSWIYSPRARFFLQGGYLRSDFDGPFFGRSRTDDQFVAGFSGQIGNFVSPNWTWNPYLLYVENDSDIELFTYDKIELGVTFRWASR